MFKRIFLALFCLFAPLASAQDAKYGPLTFSKEGYDLIVYFETGGQSYYEKYLKKISWPGGASGATGGIGYDFAYNSKEQIAKDWAFLGPKTVALLQTASGQKGAAGKLAAQRLKPLVAINWSDAEVVFKNNSMPRFASYTFDTFPNVQNQHPHVQSAMTSIVFNRGASLTGSSRLEMRNIKTDIQKDKISAVPGEIRSMKRLWYGKGLDGLITRREAEAKLVEKSLK